MPDTNEATAIAEPDTGTEDAQPVAPPKIQNPKSKIQNPAKALMLLVFGVYLLTMSGHTYSPDEETLLALSRSLVEQGSWAMTPKAGLFQVTGIDGRRYSEKGPGQSLAAVPWTATGLLVGGLFEESQLDFALRFVVGTFNALVGAGIAGLFAALCMALGYARRAGLFLGGTLAFATFLWPNSRTFFAEPLVTLCLLGSFYLIFRAFPHFTNPDVNVRQARLRLVLSGLLFAAAIATKVQYAPAVLAFLAYLLLLARRRAKDDIEGGWQKAVGSNEYPKSFFSALRTPYSALIWIGGLILGLLPLFWYNAAAFGNPFSPGYGTNFKDFQTPLFEGIYGLLLSPGKGLLWYALPLLIAIFSWASFARRHRSEAIFIAILAVSLVVVFGAYSTWHGDGAWGPRYLVPLLPFLLLPALPVVQRAAGVLRGRDKSRPYNSTLRRGVIYRAQGRALIVSIIVGLGFVVNLFGALVNFDTFLNVGYDGQTRYWMPYASPILGHASLFDQQLRGSLLRLNPHPRTILLKSGFSYSEGNKARGRNLPRWTTGMGVLEVWPDLTGGPVTATLRLLDHRPPEMPRATVTILVNDVPTTVQTAPVPDIPIGTDYSFHVNTQPARIFIESDTWNPASIEDGGRDEDIGVNLNSITIKEGGAARPYTIVEAFPAPPYYPEPLWYYDLRTSFPADVWPVYLAEADMGSKGLLLLALPLVAVGLISLIMGWRALLAGR